MKRYTFNELQNYYLGTLVYCSLTIIYILYTTIFGEGFAREPVSALVGLFVPVGVWIFFATYGGAHLVAFVYFFLLDTWTNERQYTRSTRLFLIFASLAVLTYIFDMILFEEYVSLFRLLKLLGLVDYDLPEHNL